jgi:uncharacterized cupin superfamily protein
VYVLSGDTIMVTDAGEEQLGPGDCAGFKAGDKNGHCFQNRSSGDGVLPVVSARVSTTTKASIPTSISFPPRPAMPATSCRFVTRTAGHIELYAATLG